MREDRTNKRIVPERLRQARLFRGLTLDEAAKVLEVSSQAISQYERGIIVPKVATIEKYTEQFDFPYIFFLKELNRPESTSQVFFRSYTSASKTAQKKVMVSYEWLWEIYAFMSNYIDFPELNIPSQEEIHYVSAKTVDDIDCLKIEEIAIKLRSFWNVGTGPINNLTSLLERNGVIVVKKEFKDLKTDGFSQWKDGRPFIFVSADKDSAVRIRYDLAHEVGHIILHSGISEDDLNDTKRFTVIEKEAHYFAGAFLLPADIFGDEVFSSSVLSFIPLKRRWKVSIAAMVKRCDNLKLFSDTQILNIQKYLSKNKMRKSEPLDNEIPIESPSVFRQSIKLLLENQVFSLNSLLDNLGFPKDEIEYLCELPRGFFKDVEEARIKLRPNLKVIK
jgi:Zn-dependent peptidase ImmA (M78 family)/transcriptional regulator with XRE-family HTH domain